MVDTNVLLDSTSRARPRHGQARALLERGEGLVISSQIAREYLVVATRPVEQNGFALGPDDALYNLEQLRRCVRLLPEEKPLLPTLLGLIGETGCRGKSVHDAAIVAAMLAHRVPRLVTSNPKHFERFSGKIGVDDLTSVAR